MSQFPEISVLNYPVKFNVLFKFFESAFQLGVRMLRRLIISAFFATCPLIANAADDQSWPWVLFGPRVENCAQLDNAMRQRLSRGLAAASKSTTNLLPARIWRTYDQQVFRNVGSEHASPMTRRECETFIAELEAPDLSARLRGGFFLGSLQRALFDCVLDDADKGRTFLIEFRKFYVRNGLVFPDDAIEAQLAKMRSDNRKVLNGWDTPHCMDLQRSLSSSEFDLSVSEETMRKKLFEK